MPRRTNNSAQVDDLARHLAAGRTVKSWAKRAGVSLRCAYRLSAGEAVKECVRTLRRELDDRLIGQLTRFAVDAPRRLNDIAETSTSDAARVAANRALLSAKHGTIVMDLHRRLIELEGIADRGLHK